MNESQAVRVVLDLDPNSEPIRGSLSASDQDSRPFFGWLELASAVEAARAAAHVGQRGRGNRPVVSPGALRV
jgi:hypothetical protein